MKTRFRRTTRIVTLFVILAFALGSCRVSSPQPTVVPTSLPTPTAVPPPFPKTVDLQTELKIQGSAITSQTQNCPSALEGMARGIVLGVDTETCAANGNTTVSMKINIPEAYLHQVFTLKIAWPKERDRGLRTTLRGSTAQIALDGEIIWAKSALPPLKNSYYYAAQSEPILLTFVPTSAGDHEIKISIPPMMVWDINSIQISTSSYPQNIMGIAYSPYRDCQDANTEDQPSFQNIESDLALLRGSATAIRTYSSIGINSQIPVLANEMGIPVYAGAWLDGDLGPDKKEMEGIGNIAWNTHIEAAIIGNEYHLRHLNEPGHLDYLLSRINEFKLAHPEIPVGTAEIDSFVFDWSVDGRPTVKPEYQPILDQIDVLFIHIYPFWSGMPVDGAAAYTVQRYQAIKALLEDKYHGTKRVIIGEAGWPSAGQQGSGYGGSSSGGANVAVSPSPVFHPETQRKYMIELMALAQEQHVDIFFFTAFNELWKTEGTDGTGRSWGTYYADRSLKYNFSGWLLPPELLPPADTGDMYTPYTESDLIWNVGGYPIYTEWPREPKGRPEGLPDFAPYSPAYMGDEKDISIFPCERNSHSGETAIKVTYRPGQPSTSELRGWSGAYWLYPEDNWGVYETGQDHSASQTLTFWARGDRGDEVVEFVSGGTCGKYNGKTPPLCPDTIQPKITTGPIRLTNQWQKYTLDLRTVDRSNIIGAFGFSTSRIYNPYGAVFYLDEITFSPEAPTTTTNVYPLPIGSTFNIYTDNTALYNHYIPSNFMGDALNPDKFSLSQDWDEDRHSGKTAIQIEYHRGYNGWAGVYWTDPENNWGERPGGYDLKGVTSLTFWAKADTNRQKIKILIGGINCYKDRNFPYHDSVCDGISTTFYLTREWKPYTVDLTKVSRDWQHVLGGFGVVVDQPGTLYLDDIIYTLDK